MVKLKLTSRQSGISTESGSSLSPQKKENSEFISTISILVLTLVLAVLLSLFVFQSFEVEGPSMKETLHDNDRLVVWKAGKTFSNITNNDYVPSRYSIIVFNQNATTGSGTDKQLIKRVIGVPGDRVTVAGEVVTIYNERNPQGFLPDTKGPQSDSVTTTAGDIDYTVQSGEVFVLGDNRNNSLDSRNFGAVDSQDIVGTLSLRFFPFNSVKKF